MQLLDYIVEDLTVHAVIALEKVQLNVGHRHIAQIYNTQTGFIKTVHAPIFLKESKIVTLRSFSPTPMNTAWTGSNIYVYGYDKL